MEFWILLTIAAAIIVLFPYIRCFFKRLILLRKIKATCQKKGYSLFPTHFLWFLGSRHSKNCDFYMETPREVFAVKLFGMPRRRTVLVFKENGDYFIRTFFAFIGFADVVRFSNDGKPNVMHSYHFRYRYREEWETKTPRRILLVNPVSMEIRRQPQRGGEVIVGAGDIVNGMEIQSMTHLLGEWEATL